MRHKGKLIKNENQNKYPFHIITNSLVEEERKNTGSVEFDFPLILLALIDLSDKTLIDLDFKTNIFISSVKNWFLGKFKVHVKWSWIKKKKIKKKDSFMNWSITIKKIYFPFVILDQLLSFFFLEFEKWTFLC